MFGSIRSIGWPYRSFPSLPHRSPIIFSRFFHRLNRFSLGSPLPRSRWNEQDEASPSCRINASSLNIAMIFIMGDLIELETA